MEHEYGVVTSVQTRTHDVGSDRFVTPAAGLIDDYVTDRRRRGKIERKLQAVVPVSDKTRVSGYARQYCDKEKNTYYYKVHEHIPQLYDTRGGQPQGKIVPDRLFQTLVQANQTPVNGNFMRIVGRSQAEDPRVRFNPASYMTSATTGLSEGFAQADSVNKGQRTMFGQPVKPPSEGTDPSNPAGPSNRPPGDLPPPPRSPPGDDDDDNSGGGGGYMGPFVERVKVWYDKFKGALGGFSSQSIPTSTALVPTSTAVVPSRPQPGNVFQNDRLLEAPSTVGELTMSPEMSQVVRQTPVSQFQTVALRRSTRQRNQVYDNLNEDSMAAQAFSARNDDYQMTYRPQERPRLNPREVGRLFQDRQRELGYPASKPASKSATDGSADRSGSRPFGARVMTLDDLSSSTMTTTVPAIAEVEQTGQLTAENLKKIERAWLKNVNQAIASITDSNFGKFIRHLNNLKTIVKFLAGAAAFLGAGRVVYQASSDVGSAIGAARDRVGELGGSVSNFVFGQREGNEISQQFYDEIRQIIEATPALDPRTGNPPDQAHTRIERLTFGSGQVGSIFPDIPELGIYNTGSETERPSRTVDRAIVVSDDDRSDLPTTSLPTATQGSTEANSAILVGLMSALFMGTPIMALLASRFGNRNLQGVRAQSRGSLSDRSESLEQVIEELQSEDDMEPPVAGPSNWREREKRKRKVIYKDLGESSMSKKSGKEKDYSEDGI